LRRPTHLLKLSIITDSDKWQIVSNFISYSSLHAGITYESLVFTAGTRTPTCSYTGMVQVLLLYLFSLLVKLSQNNDLTDSGSKSTGDCTRVQPKMWGGGDNLEKENLRVI
jgi:hypothetical protein